MRLVVKLGLFLSAYLPLFLILAIKTWFDVTAIVILLAVVLYSFVWFLMIWVRQKETTDSYNVVGVENKSKEALTYLVPYIIAFISFDMTKWQDLTALFVLMLLLFVVYVNSDLLYINPLLALFSYQVYQVEVKKIAAGCDEKKWDITVLSSEKIHVGDNLKVRDLSDNVFLGMIAHG
jgi:hypothetical protein